MLLIKIVLYNTYFLLPGLIRLRPCFLLTGTAWVVFLAGISKGVNNKMNNLLVIQESVSFFVNECFYCHAS